MQNPRAIVAYSLLVMAALPFTGCGLHSLSVSGKTYQTADGDLIKFFDKGEAREINGVFGTLYGGQSMDFDSNGMPEPVECKYSQKADKVILNCEGVEGIVFTVNKDHSLTGPAEGLWHHTAFSHMSEVKK